MRLLQGSKFWNGVAQNLKRGLRQNRMGLHKIGGQVPSANYETMICAYMKLNGLLENEVHGIQRVPALMYKNPLDSLESLDLSKYEVLFTEP